MESGRFFIPAETLGEYMEAVFLALGVPAADAALCAGVLLAADLRGIDSHGISRLRPVYYQKIRDGLQAPVTRIETVREGPCTAVLDGGNGMGMVIGARAMALAVEKAGRYGLGMVAVRNSTHFGIAGYYTMMASLKGMIGVCGSNARPSIAPTFGVQNMLGTNPLSFALPTDEAFPFVLDCATSVTQRGKIEICARKGLPLPEGWVIGEDGRPVSDAARVLNDLLLGKAALAPLGGIGEETAGYKGYGFATVVEVLSSALQGGAFLWALSGLEDGRKVPNRLGHFFIAVDIGAFCEPNEFRKTAGDIMRALRASKKAPGADRIFTAGEKEHFEMQRRLLGGIPVLPSVRAEMNEMRETLGLEFGLPWD